MKISETVRAAVDAYLEQGGTVYALAKASGVLDSTILRWLEGNRDIRASTIDALAYSLGVKARQTSKQAKTARSAPQAPNSQIETHEDAS